MIQEDYIKIYEYKSMGKEYNGEKACISLTSWKARINTVTKTLFSLIKQCPGFHIVLVLSKDEFPLMEKELPNNLMLFVKNKLIELLWIRPNLKSFKKVLFTMDKYRNVPVISADDDCIYQYNYADDLYKKWVKNKSDIIGVAKCMGSGYGIIFPPYVFNEYGIKFLKNSKIILTNHDDLYYRILAEKMKINFYGTLFIQDAKKLVVFHDENESITSKKTAIDKLNQEYFNKIIKCN